MQKQKGFTLIELIMVIVILGILAAFAIPKFVNLTDDARNSLVQGARGSVASTSALVHASSLAQGTSSAASGESVSTEEGAIALVYGYPAASAIDSGAGLGANDFTIFGIDSVAAGVITATAAADTGVLITTKPVVNGAKCFYYVEATASAPATISAIATLDITQGASATALDSADTCN